jgi:hypothetical protein
LVQAARAYYAAREAGCWDAYGGWQKAGFFDMIKAVGKE